MKRWALGLALAGILEAAQLDLDCARPAAARDLIGRVMLSEIEWAEDVNREALWEAFGRCADRPRAESVPRGAARALCRGVRAAEGGHPGQVPADDERLRGALSGLDHVRKNRRGLDGPPWSFL